MEMIMDADMYRLVQSLYIVHINYENINLVIFLAGIQFISLLIKSLRDEGRDEGMAIDVD